MAIDDITLLHRCSNDEIDIYPQDQYRYNEMISIEFVSSQMIQSTEIQSFCLMEINIPNSDNIDHLFLHRNNTIYFIHHKNGRIDLFFSRQNLSIVSSVLFVNPLNDIYVLGLYSVEQISQCPSNGNVSFSTMFVPGLSFTFFLLCLIEIFLLLNHLMIMTIILS